MENIENRIFYYGEYYDAGDPSIRRVSLQLKHGQFAGIVEAARKLSPFFNRPDTVVIPVPSHNGKAGTALILAREIARRNPNVRVLDAVMGRSRESVYDLKRKKRDLRQLDSTFFGFRLVSPLPRGMQYYVLDNVIGTGFTLKEIMKLIPDAKAVAFALNTKSFNFRREVLDRMDVQPDIVREEPAADNRYKKITMSNIKQQTHAHQDNAGFAKGLPQTGETFTLDGTEYIVNSIRRDGKYYYEDIGTGEEYNIMWDKLRKRLWNSENAGIKPLPSGVSITVDNILQLKDDPDVAATLDSIPDTIEGHSINLTEKAMLLGNGITLDGTDYYIRDGYFEKVCFGTTSQQYDGVLASDVSYRERVESPRGDTVVLLPLTTEQVEPFNPYTTPLDSPRRYADPNTPIVYPAQLAAIPDRIDGVDIGYADKISILTGKLDFSRSDTAFSMNGSGELIRIKLSGDGVRTVTTVNRNNVVFNNLNQNAMNEKNLKDLKELILGVGFDESVYQQAVSAIQDPNIPNFSLRVETDGKTVMGNTAKFELFFNKSKSTDNYFFPRYRTELYGKDEKLIRAHTFEVFKGSIKAMESVNQLEGRAVRTVVNFNGTHAEGYSRLDLEKNTDKGYFKHEFFNDRYGVDVPLALDKSHVVFHTQKEKDDLAKPLVKGNLMPSNFIAWSVEQKGYVSLNPQFKNLDYYTRDFKPVDWKDLGQGQGKPIVVKPLTESQKEEAALWFKDGALTAPPKLTAEQLQSVPDRIGGVAVDKEKFLLYGKVDVGSVQYRIGENGHVAVNLPLSNNQYELTVQGVQYVQKVESKMTIDPDANPLISREESEFTATLLDDIENGVGAFGRRAESKPVIVADLTQKQAEGFAKFTNDESKKLPNLSPKQLASVPDAVNGIEFTKEMKQMVLFGLSVRAGENLNYFVDDNRILNRSGLSGAGGDSITANVMLDEVSFNPQQGREARPWEGVGEDVSRKTGVSR